MSNSSLLSSVIKIASGTALAQIIVFVFTPILTRLYSVEDFGIQSLFVSYVGVLSALSTLSYHMAIVLPKRHKAVGYLVAISIAFIIVFSIFLIIIAGLMVATGTSETHIKLGYQLALLIPFAVIAQGFFSVLNQCMVREKRFSFIAQTSVEQSLFSCFLKMSAGILYPSALILAVSNVLALIYASLRVFSKTKNFFLVFRTKNVFSKVSAIYVIKRFNDFAVYRTPQVFIAAISFGAPAIVLSHFFGARAVGLYAVAASIVSAPVMLLGGGIQPVFYQRFNEIKNDFISARRLLLKSTFVMFLIGVSQFFFFAFIDYSFYELVFGRGWYEIGDFAFFLSLWAIFQLANRPVVAAIPVLGKQKLLLIWEILSSAARVLALIAGGAYFNSVNVAIGLFAGVGAVTYLVLIVWIFRSVDKS